MVSVCFPFALNHKCILRQISLLTAKVLNFILVFLAQIINPQAVTLRVYNLAKLILQAAALGHVQQALKDRVLHPLSIVNTLLGNLPKTFSTGCVFRIHVVSDKYQHKFSLP